MLKEAVVHGPQLAHVSSIPGAMRLVLLSETILPGGAIHIGTFCEGDYKEQLPPEVFRGQAGAREGLAPQTGQAAQGGSVGFSANCFCRKLYFQHGLYT